eukprot:CAMPEP_0177543610 /NCGR_PEP_ID=MMETSP0369-20130122/61502_1 /TAXON_ID=447022 ORGANISM="Scrippsiella hangoei-like, Strain SHHI-4" /NCGR_SAMPLE_ID=MMETSP0369 /ASSEMBLY_ACC=CAM_ASM_000364 /LENGTH=134 /DNA_ID=CAMNT_0019027499 /DNA_START=9 /DNA_END=409 /DNA_ORIENTATION=+
MAAGPVPTHSVNSFADGVVTGLVTPASATSRERVDPKIIAAMVNRFVADSAEFLQAFARKAEVRLLELSRKLQRLEQLVKLFETKVKGLEAAEPKLVPALVACAAAPAAAESPAGDEATGPQEAEQQSSPPAEA